MRNKAVEAMKKDVIPFNLQFFATDGTGGEDNNPDDSGDNNNDNDDGKDGVKSFDDMLGTNNYQSEFDRRVRQAINTALTKQKDKYEALMDDKLSEADKLAKMTKEEKQEYMTRKHEQELADRERDITKRELMAEAKNTLAEKKLPVSLADVLNYDDAESCNKSIEAVEKAFQEAVAVAVEEKLKGGAPMKKAPENEATQLDEIMKAMSE